MQGDADSAVLVDLGLLEGDLELVAADDGPGAAAIVAALRDLNQARLIQALVQPLQHTSFQYVVTGGQHLHHAELCRHPFGTLSLMGEFGGRLLR